MENVYFDGIGCGMEMFEWEMSGNDWIDWKYVRNNWNCMEICWKILN